MVISDQEYRRKVLQPRPGMRREDWMPIPALDWVSGQPGVDLNEQAKLFMRWLMAAVDATLGAVGAPVQFVVLLGVESRPGELKLSVICPFEAPLALMRAGDAKRDLPRITELDIDLRFGVLADTRVPVVVDCDRRADRYAFNNFNQLQEPRQFMNPRWCGTTSGFLNFIGAREIDGAKMIVMSNLAAIRDDGLDEWFRWLYCTTETGFTFDSGKLLVRVDDPETWVYDYDGS